jgi:1,4-alpha-glucan branching enzyme
MATAVAKQTKKARKQVVVEFQSENASEVFIAGTFNDWDPTRERLSRVGSDGRFQAALALPKGRYEYKLVVDNVWCTDPKNPESVPNDLGGTNSVLIVP